MKGCLLLLALSGTGLLAQTGSSSIEALWKQAVELQQEGKLDNAAEAYRAVLQLQPEFVPALSNLGTVYSRLGRHEDAVEWYRKALDLQPSHFGIRLNLAIAFYQQSLMEQTIDELELLNKFQPSNPQVLQLLGDVYLRTGENRKVIALLSPGEAGADKATAYLLGTALVRDSQVTRGQRLIDRVFRENSAESLMLLGATQIAAQENKKALATLAEAIAKNRALPGLYSLYGQAKLTDGDPAGGKEAFLKELEHNPGDYDAHLQLGALFRIERDFDQAKKHLELASRMRPSSLAVKYQMANLDLSSGDTAKATATLEEVIKQSPDFVEGHITLATAYYRLKRKSDGDREREIVNRLNAEVQARDIKK